MYDEMETSWKSSLFGRCIRGVSVGLDDIRSRIGCLQHLGSELNAHLYEQT